MALSASVIFEVRTTGSDSNGGGFKPGASGTDYSQQDAAQVTQTQGAASSSTAVLTDLAAPFTAALVGNVVQVAGGVGVTLGFYEVTGYTNTSNITLDRTCASIPAATDIQYKIGGALASPGKVFEFWGAGNICYLKNNATLDAVYTLSSSSNVAAGRLTFSVSASLIGYNTTRGDITAPTASAPTLRCGANSVKAITISANHSFVTGIIIDGDYPTRTGTIAFDGNSTGVVTNVIVKNCGGSYAVGSQGTMFHRIVCTGNLGINVGAFRSLSDSIIQGGTNGLTGTGNGGVTNVLFYKCTTAGLQFDNPIVVSRCTFAYCGVGLILGANNPPISSTNNLFYGCTTYGIDVNAYTTGRGFSFNDAFGANGTAATRGARLTVTNAVTLNGNPFVNSGTDDYDIDGASVGGLQLKSAGASISFGNNSVPGTFDIGSNQIAPAGSVIVVDD